VLKVSLVAKRLGGGGATRAALRILGALEQFGEEHGILAEGLAVQPTKDWRVAAPLPMDAISRARRRSSRFAASARDRLPWASDDVMLQIHSRADVWTGLSRTIERGEPDVVNLHWLGTGTLSVGEIGRIRRPIVWTLHDMWPFSGAEHVTEDRRYQRGYRRGDRASGERGVDWNRSTWLRKQRGWRTSMHLVAPSRWMADMAQRSALTGSWPLSVIPNPVDATVWRPMEQGSARDLLGLPQNHHLVLFGSDGGEAPRIKGADLLQGALTRLPLHLGAAPSQQPVRLVVFGGARAWIEPAGRAPYPIHHVGRIEDDRLLRAVYAAADVMVVPSRMDNFPNVALEAQACGTPVIAFRVGGIPEIVIDRVTGRLVEPFDVEGLALAISELLTAPGLDQMRDRASERMNAHFSPVRVATMYAEILHEAGMRQTRARSG
jgi:glycosyltransferase involved in cell wall biosynthesis